MFKTYADFDNQNIVKEISLGAKVRKYPTKLMRYWITGNLIPRRNELKVAEIGIGRGEMKYWMDSLDSFGYQLWDGYDVSSNERLAGAGYSNIFFGDATLDEWSPVAKYNCIILLHFLEHLYDPEAFLTKITPFVEEGGVIVGGMPSTPTFLIPAFERQMRKKASDFGHVSAFSAERLRSAALENGYSVEFLSGGYFARIDGSFLEDQVWWLKFNAWFAKRFNSVGTEIYFKFKKV